MDLCKPQGFIGIDISDSRDDILIEYRGLYAYVAFVNTGDHGIKVTYIRCVKPGKVTRIAYGVNPVCPVGYVKK